MKVLLDFGGFYHSVHSQNIDWRVEGESEYEGLEYDDYFDKVDWRATHEEYSIAYVDRLNNILDLNLEYSKLISPRYYNYTTDKIEVNVKVGDLPKLLNVAISDELREWCEEREIFKSSYGYIHFYDSFDDLLIKGFKDVDDKAVLLSLVFDYLIEHHGINDDIYDLEYELEYNMDNSIGV